MTAQYGPYAIHAAKRRAQVLEQEDRMAEMVSEGMSLTEAGAALGVKQRRTTEIWRSIRDRLGWQAV